MSREDRGLQQLRGDHDLQPGLRAPDAPHARGPEFGGAGGGFCLPVLPLWEKHLDQEHGSLRELIICGGVEVGDLLVIARETNRKPAISESAGVVMPVIRNSIPPLKLQIQSPEHVRFGFRQPIV